MIRKTIFWVHLCIGLAAGLIIALMAVTGVLLTYEQQISDWANRGYRQQPPVPDAQRLTVAELLETVKGEKSQPTGITFMNDPAAPAGIMFGRGRTIYVNPYTGAVHGEGSPGVKAFFRQVTDWHRWLALSGEQRTYGRAVTGACNLGFLFLVVSGIYLWWPRRWNWRTIRPVLLFQSRLRGKARDWNWHHVIGFWCFVPLLVIVLSGVIISYPWAGNMLYRLAGENPPAQPVGPRQAGTGIRGPQIAPMVVVKGVEPALAAAQQYTEGWRSVSLMIPKSAESPLVFTIDHGNGRQPQKRAELTLTRTGEVVKWEPFAGQSLGRRLRMLARFGHTGEVAGMAGQTIAGLASAGTVVLVWTGMALSWRRWIASRRRATAVVTEVQLA